MNRGRATRVLLLWPGTEGAAAGNFGVPQLVTMATYVREKAGAHVEIVDLVCERALAGAAGLDLRRLFAGADGQGYDVVGLSCYASYDYLKSEAIARVAREVLPGATIVVGGYHASARPAEFLDDGAPFDVVVIGEGERPLAKLAQQVASGERPRGQIVGPEPIENLDDLPPTDWSFLAKYLPVMRKVASQVQLYLSRGCPFDCAFCMERAKREVSWRAFSVDRAIDEVRRLAAFADLAGMTVYIADALFGMRPSWRRAFLAALARERLPALKVWLLVRVDLVDDEDLRLFAEANCAPGFGLESGDPALLGVIRKAGRLDDYLDRMKHIAARARELDVPWGANVIVGHPGETEATLRTTAAYLRELFLDPRGTTGFLSVDPFRLYPGSPIDDERAAWEARFGTRFHRPSWWKDGDQEFLSEWVDPSASLDYRRRAALSHELLAPVAAGIRERFSYKGPSREYFLRAIDDQVETMGAGTRLHFVERCYAWHRYLGKTKAGAALLRRDTEARELLRDARGRTLAKMAVERFGGEGESARAWLEGPVAAALREAPRERFVPLDQVHRSARDEALPLDESGLATVSALHAYERSFRLAGVREGARVLDVGSGSGYGTALLARVVGATGAVVSIEVDPRLCGLARVELGALADVSAAGVTSGAPAIEARVTVLEGDARDEGVLGRAAAAAGGVFDAIVCGFAVEELPAEWLGVLREGGVAVAPVGAGEVQSLVRAVRRQAVFESEARGEVRYVRARGAREV